MNKKIEWYGEITGDGRTWLSFTYDDTKGYEYDTTTKPKKIIVTTDDNNGSLIDIIGLDLEPNTTQYVRKTNVEFYQLGGKHISYEVTQKVGHSFIETSTYEEISTWVFNSMSISPVSETCECDATEYTFKAIYSHKPKYVTYSKGYYADNPGEEIKIVKSERYGDVQYISDPSKFIWTTDNGTITNGKLTFNENVDRNNYALYNVTATYKDDYNEKNATGVLKQKANDKTATYTVNTNIPNATATFTIDNEIISAITVAYVSDNEYTAICEGPLNSSLKVSITGSKNEIITYSLDVSPKKWDIKESSALTVTVTSNKHVEENDFSNNSYIYPDNIYNATININRKASDSEASYSAILPDGITDESVDGNFTYLKAAEGSLKDGGEITYYLTESEGIKAKISVSNSTSDDKFLEDKMITLVYDYGIVGRTLETRPQIMLYRSKTNSSVEAIYVATTSQSTLHQGTFDVIEIKKTDKTYITNDGTFYVLNISNHHELVVNGNKVIVFLKLIGDNVPDEMQYYNGNITAVRIPTPYTKLDNACLYCNTSLHHLFLGNTISLLVSDCLAGFASIKEMYFGYEKAPTLKKGNGTGHTFRDTYRNSQASSKDCIIYGVKGSYDSYHVDSNDPWQWDGCIYADVSDRSDINNSTKTWRIDTDTYTVDKELEIFKEKVINANTGDPIV